MTASNLASAAVSILNRSIQAHYRPFVATKKWIIIAQRGSFKIYTIDKCVVQVV